MGLFSWIKDGIIIEKKKEPVLPIALSAENQTAVKLEPTAEIKNETPAAVASAILYPSQTPPHPPVEPAPNQQTYGFHNALSGQTLANQNLLVITPGEVGEISSILSNLVSGNPCIVSLSKIADAQRHLDYICGFMNAIGGTILQRTPTEYVLTPKGVGIKNANTKTKNLDG
jgi:FtsZ-interacting cell division protein YlmF